MKDLSDAEIIAYAKRTIIPRDMLFVQPRDFVTDIAHDFGFWNGIGDVSLDTTDGLTLQTVTRNFSGRGSVLTIGDIPVSDSLKVISVNVSLDQLETSVANSLRGYNMRYAPVQIFRALFNIDDQRNIVAPARCRFVGFVNGSVINTPKVGGNASATLELVGCTNELTRTNTDLRSDESQRRRNASDSFYQWVDATGQVQVFWGQGKSTDGTVVPDSPYDITKIYT